MAKKLQKKLERKISQRKKTREKNAEELLPSVQVLRLLPKKEKKNTLLRVLKDGINPVWCGWKQRACNRPVGLLLACGLAAGLWACCWPCGLACLLLLLFFFFFNTRLHLKHNIKFRLYKIKMMHVNKFFLYNVIK